jgi:hypothetical protein
MSRAEQNAAVTRSKPVPDRTELDSARDAATKALGALRGICSDAEVGQAKKLVETLRNHCDYELMGQLAEAVSRLDPKDAKNRRLYGQYLIDTGKVTVAIDVLQALAKRLSKHDAEYAEVKGLLGRSYKQIFFDAGDKTSAGAREALKQAIATYRQPYEDNAANTWHGVNLVALLTRARALGLRMAPGLDPARIAQQIVATLQGRPEAERDEWHLSTLAEASLGLRNWEAIEPHIRNYATSPTTRAFQIASTLRQFGQVWNLQDDERGKSLLQILRARLLELRDGAMQLSAQELLALQRQPSPSPGQLEAILGPNGAKTFAWWKTGLDCASSVAAIRQRLGSRVGTGFLIRAGDLGLARADELLVLTNFHVVNEKGASPGIQPGDAEVVFEAVEGNKVYEVAEIAWSSPPDRHDASLLRLAAEVEGVMPLQIAPRLPVIEDAARVYIIGHPGGRELAFSFQDNELLDHEGPPAGLPQIEGVCRLHYRAPTEGGSSGSPVFNSNSWQVIALHHKGGKIGMPRLNGKEGSYGANEGISIQSIAAAIVR